MDADTPHAAAAAAAGCRDRGTGPSAAAALRCHSESHTWRRSGIRFVSVHFRSTDVCTCIYTHTHIHIYTRYTTYVAINARRR